MPLAPSESCSKLIRSPQASLSSSGPDDEALFKRHAALAAVEPNVHFAGRLAKYRYYNMDLVGGSHPG
jgi:UDP-galactopyranose mutase